MEGGRIGIGVFSRRGKYEKVGESSGGESVLNGGGSL